MANQYKNKVVYNGNTLIDLTSTTATADKILSGYGAFGADGAWMNGTATGGGGSVTQDQDGFIVLPPDGDGGGTPSVSGLVYESGEVYLENSQSGLSITFTKQHEAPPIFFTVARQTSGETFSNYNAPAVQTISGSHFVNALNVSTIETKNSNPYYQNAIVVRTAKTTSSAASITNTALSCTTDGATKWSSYVTSVGLFLSSADTYQKGTYKWIAVWAPTT